MNLSYRLGLFHFTSFIWPSPPWHRCIDNKKSRWHLLHLALNCLKISGCFWELSRTWSRTKGNTRALGDARRRLPRKRQEWWQAVKHLREAVRFFCKAVKFLREAATFPAYVVKHSDNCWCDTWCDHWCYLYRYESVLKINLLSARCKRCGYMMI